MLPFSFSTTMKVLILFPCILAFKLSSEESNSFLKRQFFNEDSNDDLERECIVGFTKTFRKVNVW